MGNTGQGYGIGFIPIPAGKSYFEFFGGGHGVIKEHLVEIPYSKKKNCIGIFVLYFFILLHHRSKLLQKNYRSLINDDIFPVVGFIITQFIEKKKEASPSKAGMPPVSGLLK